MNGLYILIVRMFDMFRQEEIKKVLHEASRMDSENLLFGAETHRYRLNPPIVASAIRIIEEKYGFKLPDDYFGFITDRNCCNW